LPKKTACAHLGKPSGFIIKFLIKLGDLFLATPLTFFIFFIQGKTTTSMEESLEVNIYTCLPSAPGNI
jgi:hypothetical protein